MQLDNLISAVGTYTTSSETASVLTTAFQIVVDAHRGHERINGEPFISHPLAVAETLAKWHAPLHIVAVGLLYAIKIELFARWMRGHWPLELTITEID